MTSSPSRALSHPADCANTQVKGTTKSSPSRNNQYHGGFEPLKISQDVEFYVKRPTSVIHMEILHINDDQPEGSLTREVLVGQLLMNLQPLESQKTIRQWYPCLINNVSTCNIQVNKKPTPGSTSHSCGATSPPSACLCSTFCCCLTSASLPGLNHGCCLASRLPCFCPPTARKSRCQKSPVGPHRRGSDLGLVSRPSAPHELHVQGGCAATVGC